MFPDRLISALSSEHANLFELKPQRNLEWETAEGDRVVLLVPKFRNRWIVKWFVPMMAKPNIRVRLDAFGSYCWQQCDGKTMVRDIGERMAARFGEPIDSLVERIGKFVATLARDKFVLLDP
jgi:hypothetical protein